MDECEPIVYEARIHGRIKPENLSSETQLLIMRLKRALANEPWMEGAQVTFDRVYASDIPPTIDVIKRMPHTELEPDSYIDQYERFSVSVNWTKFYVD